MTYGPFGESAITDEAQARAHLTHDHSLPVTRRGQTSWALWEFGATPYVVLITIYIFAPYFSSQVVGDEIRGQAIWGYINGIAGFTVALLAPVLGSIADSSGKRKPWLAGLMLLMAPCLFALWYALPGGQGLSIAAIAILITVITVSYEFSTVFHNAMLPAIVSERRMGSLSGLGLALGNAGSVVLLIALLWGFALPGQVDLGGLLPSEPLFGLDPDTHEPSRLSGPLVAVWALVFTIPILLYTPDVDRAAVPPLRAVREGVASLRKTLSRLTRHYQNIALYLLARMLFNDGKTAIMIFGGVYAAGIFSWGLLDLLIYSISLSVFAVLGGLIGGRIDDHLGSKAAVIISIGLTTVGLIAIVSITPDSIFFIPVVDAREPVWAGPFLQTLPEQIYVSIGWILAMSITAAYAASRTLLARLAPAERMSEFFGLSALSGKATAFMAPLTVAFFTDVFNSQRIGLASIVLLLVGGLALMLYVREERAQLAPE